uniref:(northern house mosquito) hypothetical protein n=1 Tax=Culex pipiens TaxID=7175 RepID=A0A8D8FYU6_CULPI
MVPRMHRSGCAGRQVGLSGAQLGPQVGTAADHQCCQVRSAECGYAGTESTLLEVFPDSAVDQVRQQHGLFRQYLHEIHQERHQPDEVERGSRPGRGTISAGARNEESKQRKASGRNGAGYDPGGNRHHFDGRVLDPVPAGNAASRTTESVRRAATNHARSEDSADDSTARSGPLSEGVHQGGSPGVQYGDWEWADPARGHRHLWLQNSEGGPVRLPEPGDRHDGGVRDGRQDVQAGTLAQAEPGWHRGQPAPVRVAAVRLRGPHVPGTSLCRFGDANSAG